MPPYILSCGSTADLTREQMARRDIRYVCYRFTLDGEEYADDMGLSITPAELYARMMAGAEVKTSQVPVAEYARYFAGLLAEGLDVLHVEFSGGLSGSVNAARLAAEEVAPPLPGAAADDRGFPGGLHRLRADHGHPGGSAGRGHAAGRAAPVAGGQPPAHAPLVLFHRPELLHPGAGGSPKPQGWWARC